MTTQLFKPTADGKAYDIQPAGVLLLLAHTVYHDDDATPEGKGKALRAVESLMKAACDGGYRQGDILMTLLFRDEVTQRTKLMATEAMRCAGDERVNMIFTAMRRGAV